MMSRQRIVKKHLLSFLLSLLPTFLSHPSVLPLTLSDRVKQKTTTDHLIDRRGRFLCFLAMTLNIRYGNSILAENLKKKKNGKYVTCINSYKFLVSFEPVSPSFDPNFNFYKEKKINKYKQVF